MANRRLERTAPAPRLVPVPEPFRNPLAPVNPRPTPTLLPLIGRADDLTPALERTLHPVALRAKHGDWAARDALFGAFEPKLWRIARNLWTPPASPATVGVWEHADVWQEAWLVFATLVDAWQPDIPFGRYLLANFPWRLRDIIRRTLARPTAPPRWGASQVESWDQHPSPESHQAMEEVLIDVLCDGFGPVNGAIARLYLLDRQVLTAISTELGIPARTVNRRWRQVRSTLREDLGDG